MRVALVHDDLVQWGGAERILLGISDIFPDAPIFTSVYDRDNKYLSTNFVGKKIITSFLQKIPGWKKMYRAFLPFYPLAFEQFNFDNFDLVISNTTRFAKSIITKPKTVHVCYCHTPPRFLWHLSGENNYGISELLMTKLRLYDQVASQRVDFFIAGSQNSRYRIKKIYHRDAKVVYPFVELDRFKNVASFNGEYFLTVGRPSWYKRFDLVREACEKLDVQLKTIEGNLSDELVVKILAGCRALIIAGEEDFGISSLEAQALGKGVVAYKKGGSLETVIEKQTGIFFEEQTVESLMQALSSLGEFDANLCKDNAARFSKQSFCKNFKHAIESYLI